MEKNYNIGYAIVSLIFVTNAIGFIMAAFTTDYLLGKLGRAKLLALCESIMVVGYIIIVCTPPFAAVVVSFLVLGLGYGVNLALNNVYCANFVESTIILSISQGSYGVGGLVAPFVATSMVSAGILWSRFYFILLSLRAFSCIYAGYVFWNYEKDTPELSRVSSRSSTRDASKWELLKRTIRNRTVLMGALFIFAYQGAEVSLSGWVISFLIAYRKGDPSKVGFVTAGFWGGVTLGRFFLTHPAHRIGEKRSVCGLVTATIGVQLLLWWVPNIIGDAVAVAIIGLLLGPVYPCAQSVFTKLIPRRSQEAAVGFIIALGSSGGAAAPFTTGLLAQLIGTYILHPICIVLYVAMLGCWFTLPKVKKPTA
jgi:fucose permease